MKRNGIDDDEAYSIVDAIKKDFGIMHSHDPKMFFMLGLSRLYVEGDITDAASIRTLRNLLPLLMNRDNFAQFKNSANGHDFNGMSLSELEQEFDWQANDYDYLG